VIIGEKLFSITAEELRTRYLKSVAELVSGNQISVGRESNIKTHIKHYVEFVGKAAKIQNIDKKFFQGYRQFRQSMKQDITMTAVVNETISIKQMYRWAAEEGLISATYIPNFGRINVRKNEVRRESFSIEDYTRLTTVGGKWYLKVPKDHPNRDEEIYYRRLIQDFVVLMGNFGFRTSELLLLKFSDVEIHDNDTATVPIRAETFAPFLDHAPLACRASRCVQNCPLRWNKPESNTKALRQRERFAGVQGSLIGQTAVRQKRCNRVGT